MDSLRLLNSARTETISSQTSLRSVPSRNRLTNTSPEFVIPYCAAMIFYRSRSIVLKFVIQLQVFYA